MKYSTFAGTALATLLTLTIGPAPAADAERAQQQTQSSKQYRYMGNAPTFDSVEHNTDGSVSSKEFQARQQRKREPHQQQYQQRQQQMHQERMNLGSPGGMGRDSGGWHH